MQAPRLDPPSPLRDATRRIRALLERRDFAGALRAAEAALPLAPQDRDLLYLLALSQRSLKRTAEALATLTRLEHAHPGYSRLYQERGHCQVVLRSPDEARASFEQAARLNPALPATWKALHALYHVAGDTARSAHAAAEFGKLAGLPPAIVSAFSLFADGEIAEAEALVRQHAREHGEHVEGLRLLALIAAQLENFPAAEQLLAAVLARAPDYAAARYEYTVVLYRAHRFRQALAEIDGLLAADADNRAYRTLRATILSGCGRPRQALESYRELLREAPADADLHVSLGHALRSSASTAAAIDAYRAAAAVRPGCGEAWWGLANLKTYPFSDAEIARMRAEEAAPRIGASDRYQLCFALGKALEDRGEYAESFACYARGNTLKRVERPYDGARIGASVRQCAALFTPEFFAARRGWGSSSKAPIFIVGLPRSGSTLIEQILASHSRVEGTMELAELPRIAASLEAARESGSGYPGVLAELAPADFRRLAEEYLADSAFYRTGKPRFTDKMPNNFLHLGLIELMLPGAKIIDARREPMACCLSIYTQLFASGQPFAYDLADLGRYYRGYVELMTHWERALPGRIHRVQHECLVENPEHEVRRLLDYCELDFEQPCLEFHRTERTIQTASSEQVRRPISRDRLDHWRHFEPWLGELKEALGELCA